MVEVGNRIGKAGAFWSEFGVSLVQRYVTEKKMNEYEAVRKVIIEEFLTPVTATRSDTFFERYGFEKSRDHNTNMEAAEAIADIVAAEVTGIESEFVQ